MEGIRCKPAHHQSSHLTSQSHADLVPSSKNSISTGTNAPSSSSDAGSPFRVSSATKPALGRILQALQHISGRQSGHTSQPHCWTSQQQSMLGCAPVRRGSGSNTTSGVVSRYTVCSSHPRPMLTNIQSLGKRTRLAGWRAHFTSRRSPTIAGPGMN